MLESPVSPHSSEVKKIRRKLPPIPAGVEAVRPPSRRRARSAEPVSHSESSTSNSSKSDEEKIVEDARSKLSTRENRPESSRKMDTVDAGLSRRRAQSFGSPDLLMREEKVVETKAKKVEKKKESLTAKYAETVNVYGMEVPVVVKTLKMHLKDEIKQVTANRRLQLDEQEEIRILERRLQDLRSEEKRQRNLLEQKEKELRERIMADLTKPKPGPQPQEKEQKLESKRKQSPTSGVAVPVRMSPQASPRRARHKRQSSDPKISKFSPIEEDKDIEGEMQRLCDIGENPDGAFPSEFVLAPGIPVEPMQQEVKTTEAMKIAQSRGKATPPTTAVPTGGSTAHHKAKDTQAGAHSHQAGAQLHHKFSKSSESVLSKGAREKDQRLSVSHSELSMAGAQLPQLRPKSPGYYSDDEDRRRKQEKMHNLQVEIEHRKMQIEETAQLQEELRRLALHPDVSGKEFEIARQKYQQHIQKRAKETQDADDYPTGIIKPLDDDIEDMQLVLQNEFLEQRARQMAAFEAADAHGWNYSSTEYLAHKHERERAHRSQQDLGRKDPRNVILEEDYNQDGGGHTVSANAHAGMPDGLSYHGFAESRDSGMSELAHRTSDPFEGFSDYSPAQTDTDTTPPTDATPAMPLLDDVTKKSRQMLHAIGSRPLSADMDQYFESEGNI